MACPSLTPIKRGTERRLLSGSLPSELADEDWHRLRSCRCHLESGLLPPASVGDARVPLLPFSQFFLVSRTFYFFSRRRFAHSANLGDRKFSNKKEPYDLVTLYTGSEPSSSTRPSRVICSENSRIRRLLFRQFRFPRIFLTRTRFLRRTMKTLVARLSLLLNWTRL